MVEPPATSLVWRAIGFIVGSNRRDPQVTRIPRDDRRRPMERAVRWTPAVEASPGSDRRMPAKFGAHMSIAGGCDRAVRAAHAIGFQTVQLFTKNNNQWNGPAADRRARRGVPRGPGRDGDRRPGRPHVVPDQPGQPRRRPLEEVDRRDGRGSRALPGAGDRRPGASIPGAHMGAGEEAGLARIAAALDEVHRRTAGCAVRIDLETTAGQGSCLGHRFEHLGRSSTAWPSPERLGVCVDTCHIFAAGYPLGTPEEYDETIDAAGPGRRARPGPGLAPQRQPAASCGSRVDRHAGIGPGRWAWSRSVTSSTTPGSAHVPMILETPKGTEDGEDLDVRQPAGSSGSSSSRPAGRRRPRRS